MKNLISNFLSSLFKNNSKQTKKTELGISISTHTGELYIPNPNSGIYIHGAPGTGKTILLQQLVRQFILNGYTGVLHEFEGDPTIYQHNCSMDFLLRLTRTVKNNLEVYNNTNENNTTVLPVKFGFLNFSDPTKSVRVNPLSKQYIKSTTELSRFIQQFLTSFDLPVEEDWSIIFVKYVQAIALKLYTEHQDILTIPHLLHIIMHHPEAVLNWLEDLPEITNSYKVLLNDEDNYRNNIIEEIQKYQPTISNYIDDTICWVLSPSIVDSFDLNVSSKENPSFLCLGNSPEKYRLNKPFLSCIINTVLKNIDTLNNRKSVFLCDEYPALKLDAEIVAQAITSGRRTKASIVLSSTNQDAEIHNYGQEKSEIIRNMCENKFQGSTSVKPIIDSWKEYFSEEDFMNLHSGDFLGKIQGSNDPLFKEHISLIEDESLYLDQNFLKYIPEFNTIQNSIELNTMKEEEKLIKVSEYLRLYNKLRIKQEAHNIISFQKKNGEIIKANLGPRDHNGNVI